MLTQVVAWQGEGGPLSPWIIYNGKKYPVYAGTDFGPYSKLNEQIYGVDGYQPVPADIGSIPTGDIRELPPPEQMRQEAQRQIEQYARANGMSYEQGRSALQNAPAPVTSTPTPTPQFTVQPATPATPVATPPAAPTQTVDDILNTAVDSVVSTIKEPPKPYEEVNPFFFDEQLAREAATAEYSPYYNELLQDYIQKVEKIKSRSQEDLQRTLDYLSKGKEQFLGDERRALDQAIKSTNEGFAGRGLYFSGARGKELGKTQQDYEARLNQYNTGYEYNTSQNKLASQRTIEDAQRDQELYNRDIERQKTTAIEGGILQRRSEAQDEYLAGMNKYYQNYPNYYDQYGGTA